MGGFENREVSLRALTAAENTRCRSQTRSKIPSTQTITQECPIQDLRAQLKKATNAMENAVSTSNGLELKYAKQLRCLTDELEMAEANAEKMRKSASEKFRDEIADLPLRISSDSLREFLEEEMLSMDSNSPDSLSRFYKDAAAVRLQALHRGKVGRKRVVVKKQVGLQHMAAKQVQALMAGRAVRLELTGTDDELERIRRGSQMRQEHEEEERRKCSSSQMSVAQEIAFSRTSSAPAGWGTPVEDEVLAAVEEEEQLVTGDRVECLCLLDPTDPGLYPGNILCVNFDGTVDIEFDDKLKRTRSCVELNEVHALVEVIVESPAARYAAVVEHATTQQQIYDEAAVSRMQEAAASKIQAIQRGKHGRKEVAMKVAAKRELLQQTSAAAKIQAIQRGKHGRKEVAAKRELVKQTSAVSRIQAIQRGKHGRKQVAAKREVVKQTSAVSKIQAIQRGNKDRSAVAARRERRQSDAAASRTHAVQQGKHDSEGVLARQELRLTNAA